MPSLFLTDEQMNEPMKFLHYHPILTFEPLEAAIAQLSNEAIRNVGSIFLDNMKGLEQSVSIIPRIGLSLIQYISALEFMRLNFPEANDPEADQGDVEKILAEVDLKPLTPAQSVPIMVEAMEGAYKNEPGIRQGYQSMFRASTVLAWANFEGMAVDLWAAAITETPDTYGKKTLAFLRSKDAGGKKEQVDGEILKLFRDHGFQLDLRSNLGEFLAKFIDFSGATEIKKSFEKVFGQIKLANENLTDNKTLTTLQSIRNLVAHKAGRVDDQFLQATGFDLTTGEHIILNGVEVSKYANEAMKVGGWLLQTVDGLVTQGQ